MYIKLLVTFALLCSSFAQDNTTTSTTTTTPEPTTTKSTTESTTTTTAPVTTTTTEAPASYSYYNVTSNGIACIMVDGNLSFRVEYSIGQNKTNNTEIEVPKPSSAVTVSGSCNETDGTQFIKIAWGEPQLQNSVRIGFSVAKDGAAWMVDNITSFIYMENNSFPNGTDDGKVLKSEIPFTLVPQEIAVNRSYMCLSSQSFDNFTSSIEHVSYPLHVEFHVQALHLQAFNKVKASPKSGFADEIHCDADKIADIVPIAVGCALAGLIIIVLIAYVIGRRRRSASYQSV
jgi:lysosomal-associated membrane protein 1/2